MSHQHTGGGQPASAAATDGTAPPPPSSGKGAISPIRTKPVSFGDALKQRAGSGKGISFDPLKQRKPSSGGAPRRASSGKGISFGDALKQLGSGRERSGSGVSTGSGGSGRGISFGNAVEQQRRASVEPPAAAAAAAAAVAPPPAVRRHSGVPPPPRRPPTKTLVPAEPVSTSESESESDESTDSSRSATTSSDSDAEMFGLVRQSSGSLQAGLPRKTRPPLPGALEYTTLLQKTRGRKLGIGINETDRGLVVCSVTSGGLADEAGVRIDTIIASVNGANVLKATKKKCIELIGAARIEVQLGLIDESRIPNASSPDSSPGSSPPPLVRVLSPATSKAMAAKEARLRALGLGAHRKTPPVSPQKPGPESPRRGSSPKKRSGETREEARAKSSAGSTADAAAKAKNEADAKAKSMAAEAAERLLLKERQQQMLSKKKAAAAAAATSAAATGSPIFSINVPADKSKGVTTDSESDVNFDSDSDIGPMIGFGEDKAEMNDGRAPVARSLANSVVRKEAQRLRASFSEPASASVPGVDLHLSAADTPTAPRPTSESTTRADKLAKHRTKQAAVASSFNSGPGAISGDFADNLANPTQFSSGGLSPDRGPVLVEARTPLRAPTPTSATPFVFLNTSVIDDSMTSPEMSMTTDDIGASMHLGAVMPETPFAATAAVDDMFVTTSFSDPALQVEGGGRRSARVARDASGLGLQIVTTAHGTQITQLKPDGPAQLSGKIFAGDWLLQVNGTSVLGMDHHDILALLSSTTDVDMLVHEKPSAASGGQTATPTSFSQIRTVQDAKRIAFKSMSFTRRLSITNVEGSPGSPGSQLPDHMYSLDGADVPPSPRRSSSGTASPIFESHVRPASFQDFAPRIVSYGDGPLEINLLVQPTDRFTHTIAVGDDETEFVVSWEYEVHNAALDFSLELFPNSGDQPVECVQPQAKKPSVNGHRGSWRCVQGGNYLLQFTNKHPDLAVSISLRCTVTDLSPWLDPKSQLRQHGLVRRRSALDISNEMAEEPLFNMEVFELRAMTDWINNMVVEKNIMLIEWLHKREDMQDIHDQLEYRAHGLSKRTKTKDSTKRSKKAEAKKAEKEKEKAARAAAKAKTPPPPASPERVKTVTIEPVALPLELSPLMCACFEYLAQEWSLEEVGLFRVSGNRKHILEYEEQFAQASVSGKRASLETCFEPATVCGLLKRVFQKEKLPLTPAEGQALVAILLEDNTPEETEAHFIHAVQEMPVNHSCALKCLIWLFAQIIDNEDNKMNATNLGISVGLTVFPTVELQHCDIMITYMVDSFDRIWPEDLAATPQAIVPLVMSVNSPEGDHVRYY